MNQELLRDLTESYLKSLIAEASGSLGPDFDSFAPFGELGINSFQVLKIIKKLEGDFGVLPKSLLFENFNINDLADYFARKHEQVLCAKFAGQLGLDDCAAPVNGRPLKPVEVPEGEKTPAAPLPGAGAREAEPIRVLEVEAYRRPESIHRRRKTWLFQLWAKQEHYPRIRLHRTARLCAESPGGNVPVLRGEQFPAQHPR
jgi:acyl carrier protein